MGTQVEKEKGARIQEGAGPGEGAQVEPGVLRAERASRGLLPVGITRSSCKNSLEGLGWGLGAWISNKSPRDVSAAGLRTKFEKQEKRAPGEKSSADREREKKIT